MRLAYVIGSPERSSKGPELHEFVEQLSGPSLRFRSRWLDPAEGVLEVLEQDLPRRGGPGHLLVVWTGQAHLDEDDVVLELPAHGLSLTALVEALSAGQLEVLLVLDLLHEGSDDPIAATELVQVTREIIRPSETGLSLLVSCGAQEREHPVRPSPLLRAVTLAAHEAEPKARATGSVSARHVYEVMRELPSFDELSVAGFFAGPSAFPLVLEPSVVVNDPASIPPPPPSEGDASIPESLRAGDAHYAAGRHDAAIGEYKKRLLSLPSRDLGRADVYYRIGRAKLALGSAPEAAHNFDKALELDPMHAGALDEVCDIAIAQRDFSRLEAMRRRRFAALTDLDARVHELTAIVDAYLDAAKDPKAALPVLEQWITLRPDESAFSRLVQAEDLRGRASSRITARQRLAEVQADEARAQTLIQAAEIAERELSGGKESVDLARAALAADPSALRALEIASGVLGSARRWQQLVTLYEDVIERTTSEELTWDLSKKLGVLCREQLDDAEGALAAFARAAQCKPDDVELLLWIAELYEAKREHRDASDVLRAAASVRPSSPDLVRRALWSFEKIELADAAWNAACILDHLNEADINESLLADTHRPDGLIPARATLVDADFESFAPERERALTSLLVAVASAALPLRSRELSKEGRVPRLDDSTLQSKDGTTTLARSLTWTCRLLNLDAPTLHVLDGVDGTVRVLPLAEPLALADRSIGKGVELPALTFLWARALVVQRPENAFSALFPSPEELARCVLAALAVGEHHGLGEVDGSVRRFADSIKEALSDDQREALENAARGMNIRRAKQRIESWLRTTALLGGRVGLLVAGDVRLAVDVTRQFPTPGIDVESQVEDLYRFALSTELHTLRKKLGISVKG